MFEWNMSSKTCAFRMCFKKKNIPHQLDLRNSKPHGTPNPLTFPSLAEGTTKVAFWTLTSLGFMFFQIPSTRCHIEIQLLPKIKGLQMWCDQQECQVWRAIPISFLFVRNKKWQNQSPIKRYATFLGFKCSMKHILPTKIICTQSMLSWSLFLNWNPPDRTPKNYPDMSVVLHYPRSIYPQLNVVGTQPQTQKTWVSFRDRWKIPGPNWPPPAKGSLLDLTPSPLKQTQEKTATWMSAEFWKWLVYRL